MHRPGPLFITILLGLVAFAQAQTRLNKPAWAGRRPIFLDPDAPTISHEEAQFMPGEENPRILGYDGGGLEGDAPSAEFPDDDYANVKQPKKSRVPPNPLLPRKEDSTMNIFRGRKLLWHYNPNPYCVHLGVQPTYCRVRLGSGNYTPVKYYPGCCIRCGWYYKWVGGSYTKLWEYLALYTCVPFVDNCSPNPCGPKSICADGFNYQGTYKCSCVSGYDSPSPPGIPCTLKSVCAVSSPCGLNTNCIDGSTSPQYTQYGQYRCECKTGYEPQTNGPNGPIACKDIRECDANPCPAFSSCAEPIIPGYICTCWAGYTLSGTKCVDIDECHLPSPYDYTCGPNTLCTQPAINSKVCTCKSGYEEANSGDAYNIQIGCRDIDDCASNPCAALTNAFCTDTGANSHTCTCNPGFYLKMPDNKCVDIDDCALVSCSTDATCNDPGINQATAPQVCTCKPGYQGNGQICANIDDCALTPCPTPPATTICTDGIGSRTCTCKTGFEAAGCTAKCGNGLWFTNTPGNKHGSEQCDDGGTANNDGCSSTCQVESGWSCSSTQPSVCVDIDDCTLNTCYQNSVCADCGTNCYACTCLSGFAGDGKLPAGCTDIDDCATATCRANSQCVDTGANSFSCPCDAGYDDIAGVCVKHDYCVSDPCGTGADCTNGQTSRTCECEAGKVGDPYVGCFPANNCLKTGCLGNNTCFENATFATCSCSPGYYGHLPRVESNTAEANKTCYEINECTDGAYPCGLNTDCTDLVNDFTCSCKSGFKKSDPFDLSKNFDCVNIDDCDPFPCGPNTNCADAINLYSCSCKDGFEPKAIGSEYDPSQGCRNIDDCDGGRTPAPSLYYYPPCGGNTTCTDQLKGKICACAFGFTGDPAVQCLDIDDCAPNPCPLGHWGPSVCTDTGANSYECSCPPGYAGDPTVDCTDIDDCVVGGIPSCGPNAICTDQLLGFLCHCPFGYEGNPYTNCTEIDECLTQPCLATANCEDKLGYSECTCKPGYQGPVYVNNTDANCTNIDDCSPDPCGANTYCIDGLLSYNCFCNTGYKGDPNAGCVDINECLEYAPCDINADCTNTIGSFTCACKIGYTGDGFVCESASGVIFLYNVMNTMECDFVDVLCMGQNTATYIVYLAVQPATNVFIVVESLDTTEVVPDTGLLTFTPGNWDIPQTITCTGVDDYFADGTRIVTMNHTIGAGSDAAYTVLKDLETVTVRNLDWGESVGIEIYSFVSSPEVQERNTTYQYQIRLKSQPYDDVDVHVTSTDPASVRVEPEWVRFDASNWNQFVNVTLTGLDDYVLAGDRTQYIHHQPNSTGDYDYQLLTKEVLLTKNEDADQPNFTPPRIEKNLQDPPIEGGTVTFVGMEFGNGTESCNITVNGEACPNVVFIAEGVCRSAGPNMEGSGCNATIQCDVPPEPVPPKLVNIVSIKCGIRKDRFPYMDMNYIQKVNDATLTRVRMDGSPEQRDAVMDLKIDFTIDQEFGADWEVQFALPPGIKPINQLPDPATGQWLGSGVTSISPNLGVLVPSFELENKDFYNDPLLDTNVPRVPPLKDDYYVLALQRPRFGPNVVGLPVPAGQKITVVIANFTNPGWIGKVMDEQTYNTNQEQVPHCCWSVSVSTPLRPVYGPTEFSQILHLKDVPLAPKPLSFSDIEESTVTLQWEAMNLPAELNGAPVLAYEIYQDDVKIVEALVDLYPDNKYEVRDLETYSLYSYKVRARNSIGWGPFSTTSILRTKYGRPRIYKVTPDVGPTAGNNMVTITGEWLGLSVQNVKSVTMGNVPCEKSSQRIVNSGTLIVKVPPTLSLVEKRVDIKVETDIAISPDELYYLYYPPPEITKLKQTHGPNHGESLLAIEGRNLGRSRADIKALTVSGVPCAFILYIDAENVECITGSTELSQIGVVEVTTVGGTFTTTETYEYVGPKLASFEPDAAIETGGVSITIRGTFLGESSKDVKDIVVGGFSCIGSMWWRSPELVGCMSPKATKYDKGPVKVETYSGGVGTASGIFEFLDSASPAKTPVILSIKPEFGPYIGGQVVTITGQWLGTNRRDLVDIEIAGVSCVGSKRWYNSTTITCITDASPKGPIKGRIRVVSSTAGEGISSSDVQYRYQYPDPRVVDVRPKTVKQDGGQPVIIRGNFFGREDMKIARAWIHGVLCNPTIWVSESILRCGTPPFQAVQGVALGGEQVFVNTSMKVHVSLGEKVGPEVEVGLYYGDANFRECIPACGWEGECVQDQVNPENRQCRCLPGFANAPECDKPAFRASKISEPLREDMLDWANFTLRMEEEPSSGPIHVRLFSNNTREARVKEKILVFEKEEWSIPKAVSIRGVPDELRDGNVSFAINYRAVKGPRRLTEGRYEPVIGVNHETPPVVLSVEPEVVPLKGGNMTMELKALDQFFKFTLFDKDLSYTIVYDPTTAEQNETRVIVPTPTPGTGSPAGSTSPTPAPGTGGNSTSGGSSTTTPTPTPSSGAGSNGTSAATPTPTPSASATPAASGNTTVIAPAAPLRTLEDSSDLNIQQSKVGISKWIVNVEIPAIPEEQYFSVWVINNGGTRTEIKELFATAVCPLKNHWGKAGDCKPCPDGATCPGGGRIWAEPGNYVASEQSGVVVACDPPSRCAGGPVAEESCGDGYIGNYCGECAPGYVEQNTLCQQCPSNARLLQYVVAALLVWCAMSLTGVFVRDRWAYSLVKEGMIIIQTIGAIGTMASRFLPALALEVYDALLLFLGDIRFHRAICKWQLNYAKWYGFGMTYTIGIVFLMCAAMFGAGVFAVWWHRSTTNHPSRATMRGITEYYTDRFIMAFTFALDLVYFTMTRRALEAISCFKIDDTYYMISRPADVCFAGMGMAMTTLGSVIVLLVITLGYPAAQFWLLFNNRSAMNYNRRFQARWGMLFQLVETNWFPLNLFNYAFLFWVALGSTALVNASGTVLAIAGLFCLVRLVIIAIGRPHANVAIMGAHILVGFGYMAAMTLNHTFRKEGGDEAIMFSLLTCVVVFAFFPAGLFFVAVVYSVLFEKNFTPERRERKAKNVDDDPAALNAVDVMGGLDGDFGMETPLVFEMDSDEEGGGDGTAIDMPADGEDALIDGGMGDEAMYDEQEYEYESEEEPGAIGLFTDVFTSIANNRQPLMYRYLVDSTTEEEESDEDSF